ncbi:hypothetical protein AYO47_02775 [Planctomyces sp. SCGC AG-212-M04]|nr:hypothetical protein AYO47_02775 [Planctomyces sp. SCGC AG-212-M04]
MNLFRFALLTAFIAISTHAQAELKVGVGAVVITPPQGIPMAGYYSLRGADGVHDDLYAKTLLFDDGTTRAAIISLDLISTVRTVVDEARAAIEKRTGIPGRNILIAATHSHTGPMLANANRRWNDFGGSTPLAREYTAALPGKLADSVEAAVKTLTPVTASYAIGRCEGIAFNRRFLMVDGSVAWNAGKLNPRIVRPAGPVDPELPVLSFEADKRRPIAMFVNFPIHLDTVGGPIISADVPGVVSRILADARDPQMLTLYATGCCGDINHVDISHDRPQKGFTESARIGSILAASVLRTLNEQQPVTDTTLRVRSKMVKLTAYPSTDSDMQAAEEMIRKNQDPDFKPKAGTQQLAKAYRDVDIKDRDRAPYEVEVQVITLGRQVAFVSLPGEIFVELGMTIRRASPFVCTGIAELANGSVGYIPNRVAYPQGAYEVLSTRVAAGSGEVLVDTALELLRESYREAAK